MKATTYNEAEDESDVTLRQVLDDSGRSTRTNATSFVTINNDDGTVEVRVPDLERLKFKNIWLKYDEFIECPFCRTIQKLRNDWEWRHVSTILQQPYLMWLTHLVLDATSSMTSNPTFARSRIAPRVALKRVTTGFGTRWTVTDASGTA